MSNLTTARERGVIKRGYRTAGRPASGRRTFADFLGRFVAGQRRAAIVDMIDDPERARRLAEALRENLRRRKAQGRERDDAPPPGDASWNTSRPARWT